MKASSQKELKKALKKSVAANEPLSVVTGQWDLLSKEITDEGLIRLFYDFNPSRGFRDMAGKSFSTLEEVALSFAGNPVLWDDRFLSAERRVFLEKNNHVMLITMERSDFLMDVFRDHIRRVINIDKLTPMTESDRVAIKYKISGSLEDFFQERGVREELRAKAKAGSVVISDLSKKETDTVCTETLKFIETEHNLPEKKWSQSSLESLHKDISLFQEDFIRDIQKFKQKKIIADIRQSVRSFIVLLPAVFLYMLYLAYTEKNYNIMHFLSSLSPFQFDISGLTLSSETSFDMAGNMAVMMFILILPAWILSRNMWGYIYTFIITNVCLIMLWFWAPSVCAAIALVVNSAVMFLLRTNRPRLMPFLASVAMILIIIFITDIVFKDTPPSAHVRNPLNTTVLIRNTSLTEEQPVFMYTGISTDYPIVGKIIDKDSITVIDEKQGWYLVRNQGAEGFVQAEKIGLLGFMKTPGLLPSADVTYSMNMMVTAKSNETVIRAGKSDAYAIIGLLPQNKEATAIKEDSNWYLVRYQNTEGYLKTSEVNETVIKKGRLINKNPVLRKEPNYTSKSLGNRWYGTINIYAEHDGWYLIRSYYGHFGYIPQKDLRIIK